MNNVKEMLKAVINGQHALSGEISELRKEMLKESETSRNETKEGLEAVNKRIDEVNNRLDKQGKQLAYLEEDAPTREEHDKLEKRVEKIEGHHKN